MRPSKRLRLSEARDDGNDSSIISPSSSTSAPRSGETSRKNPTADHDIDTSSIGRPRGRLRKPVIKKEDINTPAISRTRGRAGKSPSLIASSPRMSINETTGAPTSSLESAKRKKRARPRKVDLSDEAVCATVLESSDEYVTADDGEQDASIEIGNLKELENLDEAVTGPLLVHEDTIVVVEEGDLRQNLEEQDVELGRDVVLGTSHAMSYRMMQNVEQEEEVLLDDSCPTSPVTAVELLTKPSSSQNVHSESSEEVIHQSALEDPFAARASPASSDTEEPPSASATDSEEQERDLEYYLQDPHTIVVEVPLSPIHPIPQKTTKVRREPQSSRAITARALSPASIYAPPQNYSPTPSPSKEKSRILQPLSPNMQPVLLPDDAPNSNPKVNKLTATTRTLDSRDPWDIPDYLPEDRNSSQAIGQVKGQKKKLKTYGRARAGMR